MPDPSTGNSSGGLGLPNLIGAIPQLRTRIQLTGFVVLAAAILLFQIFDPANILGQLSGGFIGISLILFPLLFNFLTAVPENERVKLIMYIFTVFSFALLVAMSLLIWSISMERQDRTADLQSTIHALTEPQLQRLINERDAIAASLTGELYREAYDVWEQKTSDLERIEARIDFLRRIQSGTEEGKVTLDTLLAVDDALASDSEVHSQYMKALLAKDLGGAEAILESAEVDLRHKEFQLRDARIALLELDGRYNEAISLAREYASQQPRDHRGLLNFGRLLQVHGYYGEALEQYDRLLEMIPSLSTLGDSERALVKLQAYEGSALHSFLSGDISAAILKYEQGFSSAQIVRSDNPLTSSPRRSGGLTDWSIGVWENEART